MEQRINYKSYIEDVESDDPMSEIKYASMLGSENYIEQVRVSLNGVTDDPEISHLVKTKKKPKIEEITDAVITYYGVRKENIITRDRKKNQLRDFTIYLCRKHSNETYITIGRYFENLRPSAVSLACKRIALQLSQSEMMRKDLKEIEAKFQ